ncbi:hypothetical protein D3C74_285300 [compost metagenome]
MLKSNFVKIKRPLLSLLAIGALFIASTNVHSYADPAQNLAGNTSSDYVVTISVDDETGLASSGLPTYKFKSTNGFQPYIASGNTIWKDAGYYGSSYVIDKAVSEGETTSKAVFQKYLSMNWSQASQYTWTESNSVQWTYSGSATIDIASKVKSTLGLSTSRTTTYGVGVNIPANSSKYSKLGFASDIFNQFYYWTKTVDGTLVASERGNIKTPLQETYLIVYYQ